MNGLGLPIGLPTRGTGRLPGPTDGRTDELTHALVAERVETSAPDAHEKSNLIEIPQAPATKRGTMTTPRTAASSDARKRLAEAGASESLPPVLPDTSGWVQCKPGYVIEAGAPFVVADDADKVDLRLLGAPLAFTIEEVTPFTYWTPPPVPREPWHDLSTDRSKPTLAMVSFGGEKSVVGHWWIANGYLLREFDPGQWRYESVTSVEMLSTHDPVTQVPVDRALIDEVKSILSELQQYRTLDDDDHTRLYGAEKSLASLADAAVSKDADQ